MFSPRGYYRVGQLLRSYRAGPLPKPFKIIPSLPAWARVLALTAPEQWSPQATHAATRIFISNMKPQQARVYLEGVVLGLVRADLEQPSTRKDTRKLSPHLYEALKRALYKPSAFFKAIVFPLLDVSALDGSIFLDPSDCRHLDPCVLGRVHTQGGRDRRVRTCQS
jgi:essential nuclear protein 1